MGRVYVFGSLNIDLVAYVDELPKPGQTRHGKRFLTAAGGKGLNQAIAAARAGADVSMIGAVGADDHGRRLLEIASAEGINTGLIKESINNPTGVAVIGVDDRGENSIIIISGANQEANPNLLHPSAGDIVLAQLETPLSSVITAFKIAKDSGATTILNPAPAGLLPLEFLDLVDYLIPNEHEAEEITGIGTETNDGALAAAADLRHRGVGTCVLTLGSRGALLVNANGSTFRAAFPVTPIDTTAAGDAFCGAFAAALAAGESQNDALTFASASAALTTTAYGAVPSLPSRAAILELIGER